MNYFSDAAYLDAPECLLITQGTELIATFHAAAFTHCEPGSWQPPHLLILQQPRLSRPASPAIHVPRPSISFVLPHTASSPG